MIKYNFLLYLISPLLIIKLIFNAIYRKNGLGFISSRLGLFNYKIDSDSIWIHASSIGETKLAIKIYEKLQLKYDNCQFIMTTTTSSSAKLINNLKGNVKHLYLPIDFYLSTLRFIKSINPKICIMLETEIWPNLVNICKKNNIPTVIINARLSKRTLNTNKIVKNIYKTCLPLLTKILCKSDREKKNYINLGAHPSNTKTIGNLKFCETGNNNITNNLIERKYVLAASTHPDEERQIITEWLKVHEKKILLVVVPRHPERLGDILADLPLSMIKIAIRSKNEPIKKDTQIYIADTYGELNSLMQHCEFVFMGGSLVDHGGQNFLEAASHGKTIIVGSYMYNFIDETEEFLKTNSMIMVKNSETLKHVFGRLIKSKQRRELFGSNAKKLLESRKNIINDYCKAIQELIIES